MHVSAPQSPAVDHLQEERVVEDGTRLAAMNPEDHRQMEDSTSNFIQGGVK